MTTTGKVVVVLLGVGGAAVAVYLITRKRAPGPGDRVGQPRSSAGGMVGAAVAGVMSGGGPVDVDPPPFAASGAGYGPGFAPLVSSFVTLPPSYVAQPPPGAPPEPVPPPGAPPAPPPPPQAVTIIGDPLTGAGTAATVLYAPPTASDVNVLAKARDLAAINAAGLPPAGFIRDDDYSTPPAPPAAVTGPATAARRGRGHF